MASLILFNGSFYAITENIAIQVIRVNHEILTESIVVPFSTTRSTNDLPAAYKKSLSAVSMV
jgi:uncharacterized protein YabE (DUF348 family)